MHDIKLVRKKNIKMSLKQIVRHWKSSSKENPLPKSLLSVVTLENIMFSLRWGCVWGAIPYEYDKTHHGIIITKKAVQIWSIATLVQIINFVYFCGAMTFTLFGGESSLAKSKSNMFDIAFGFLLTMTNGALLIVNIQVGAFQREEFCCFVNSTIRYSIFIKETYANSLSKKWRNGCEELLVASRTIMIILPFLAAIHCLQHPEKLFYITSLIPRDSIFYGVTYIGYAFVRLILTIGGWATVMSIFFPMTGIVFCFNSIVEEIKPRKKVYRTKPSFRKPECLRIVIKSVQLIAIQINGIIKQIVMSEQTIVTYCTTLCVVSLIRFWDELTFSTRGVLILTVICIVGIWTTILAMSAHTYTSSEKALNTWKNYNNWSPFEKKVMKKYRKSIRPIQLEFGGFYYLRPKKILTFWNSLVWFTVRGLLSLPDNHHN